MNLPFSRRDSPELERRLRAGAASYGPLPPPELRARILAAWRDVSLHAVPLHDVPSHAVPPSAAQRAESPRAERRGTWIAAAAAVLVLLSAWWLTRGTLSSPLRERSVVALSRGILGASTRVLALPVQAEDSLRQEAAHLFSDTARLAAGLVRGLPAPLRTQLERM